MPKRRSDAPAADSPKKAKEEPKAVDSPKTTKAESKTPVKRGKGRPRTLTDEERAKRATGTGRPRGRPKGSTKSSAGKSTKKSK